MGQGESVAQVSRHIGVSTNTFYRWRQEYGGLRIDQARRGDGVGEYPFEACGGGPDPGQPDPEGGGEGKLLSPARRRGCVDLVREIYGIAERRACRALVQYRSIQRYRARVAADEDGLKMEVVGLASRYGRYGYLRVSAMLQRDGWRVNHKRVERRIWRREGLKVPAKPTHTWSTGTFPAIQWTSSSVRAAWIVTGDTRSARMSRPLTGRRHWLQESRILGPRSSKPPLQKTTTVLETSHCRGRPTLPYPSQRPRA